MYVAVRTSGIAHRGGTLDGHGGPGGLKAVDIDPAVAYDTAPGNS